MGIMIQKRNGRQEIIDISKIQKHTIAATKNLTGVSQSELEIDSRIKFIDGMSSTDIHDSLIKTAVEKIDIDVPNWTFVAARLFLFDLYHRVGRATHGIKGNAYCHLKDYIKYGQDAQRIITNLEDGYDLDDLNEHIKPQRDYLFNYLGIKTMYDRYLLKNNDKEPIELPQQMFMGIAMFLAQNETNKQEKAKEFYDVLSKFEVMLATPTLSNARTTRHQLSSCFTKGTKVRTIDGYKDIDKIELGDMVLTHKNRFMKVYELFKRDYARNLISLNINGLIQPFNATEEHPVLSLKKDDISCIRKLGNCILNQKKHKHCFSLKGEYRNDCELLDKEFSSSWNKIDDLNKGDFVSISYPKYKGKDTIYISDYIQTKNLIEVDGKMMFKRNSKSFYSVERSFLNNQILPVTNKIKLSKDFMLLIGYFLAEGHISKDKDYISFTFGSKEISYIEETKQILEDIFDIKACVNINKDNSTNVVAHSKIIALFFDKLIGTGFDKKVLNNDILFANPKVQKWLLVAAIRGDGCALSEGYQLTMSNERLIKQLFEIALRCGLSPFMKKDATKSRLATIKATHLKIGVYNDKSFILDVNKNLIKINLDCTNKSALRYFWFKDEYFMKIIDKNSTYLEDKVYNIEVEDDHSYSVAGVNVHNCYVGSSPDNIEGIFDGYKEMALLSKFGGGIGWDWNSIRSIGGVIDGHKGAAGGTVPFLKITNDIALAVDQLGCVAKDSYVKVLSKVKTDNFEHDFRKEYEKVDFTQKELLEGIASYASSFAFKYAKFSKNFIGSLLFDYIMNIKGYTFLEETYDLTHDQYKKIIGQYKKINKGLPEGFETILDYPDYAISPDGIVIHRVNFRPLSNNIDRKGYVRVGLGKNSIALHTLLAKQYLNYDENKTIDHIDGNKLNNSLNNLQIISNEKNISKGWEKTYKQRTEKARIRKHLSFGHKLKGDKRDTHKFKILDIETKIIPIGDLRIGDLILSYNIEKNETEYKAVIAKHQIDVKQENQIKLSFKDGNHIVTSNWHPFPKVINDKVVYKRSDEMKVGDTTINDKGEFVKVQDIQKVALDEDFIDLTVKDNNNYFCSTQNQEGSFHLIHNTRKGAIAVYLEPWHMDVIDFIDLKKNNGEERRRAHDLFPALWINDLFMQRILEDSHWTLFDPYEVKDLSTLTGEEFNKRYEEYESNHHITKQQMKAKDLWKKVLTSYFESGSPFLCFKDTANRANPNNHNGFIRSSNLCVTGDTRLHTQYGLVKAKELEEMNKKVIATCDNRTNFNRKEYGTFKANCLEVYKTKENAKIYEIETYDGYTIKCTNWHEFYVNRDKEIKKLPLKDMKLTDKLLIQSDEGQFGNFGTYDEGLILGLITGDGTFSKTNNGKPLAVLDLFNDEMECLKDSIHLKLNKLLNENKPLNKILKNSNNSDKIRFTSTTLAKLLNKKYNFNKETKNKVPENIFKGSKKTVVGYLQGIYTTDGTVNVLRSGKNKTPSFSIQLSNIDLKYLQDIQILLSNFGIRSKINNNSIGKRVCFDYTTKSGEYKEYTSNGTYRIDINGRNATKFIDNIGFLSNKQTRCLKILEERKVLGLSRESKKSEYFEVKIKRIEYIGREDVYDTTQLVNNSLIFNGIVTGNCTEIFQNTEANHYLIKVELENGQIVTFEEGEDVTVDSGLVKKANKLTALDRLYGEKIFIIEKEKIDGQTAVCNLASVNLSKINKDEDIKRVVPVAMRMLDNVIDLNFYPLRKVKVTNLKSRAVGLGIMGESQMLAESQIQWGSQDHFKKIDSIMEAISYNAIDASSNLAVEKGVYATFEGSKWSQGIMPMDHTKDEVKTLFEKDLFDKSNYDWDILRKKVKNQGMRNGYLMSIAPTSSISILVGTTQAIEPVYKRKWYEENLSGQIPVVVPNLSTETWAYYTPAYEIDQFDIIKAASIRQKWIDQGQSTNIFISLNKASGKYLHEIYTLAWRLGLKSTYYLRSQSPEAVEDVVDRSMECVGCQ